MSTKLRVWPFAVTLVLLCLINLPLGHLKWTDHRLDNDGVVVTGAVEGTRELGEKRFVTFRLPLSADPDQQTYTVEVGERAFRIAEEQETVEIVHLPGKPATHRAVDRVPTGSLAVWLTAMANLTLAVMLGLMLWSRRHGILVLEATEDVTRCKPDDTVLELGGEMFLVRGDILEIHDDYIVLLCNSDRVKVILGEHHNPVGHQQPAQVRGRKVTKG